MPKLNAPSYKQKLFVSEYVSNGFNATQAALKSYNTSSCNTAHSIGSENLRKPAIRDAIALQFQELSPEVQKKLTPDWICSKLLTIAESSRQDSCKLKALELLGETKFQKLFEKHSVVLNITPTKSESDLDAEYRALLRMPQTRDAPEGDATKGAGK